MARTAEDIIADIGAYRRANRDLFKRMEGVAAPLRDPTLEVVALAYVASPFLARSIHKVWLANDLKIAEFTQELIECESAVSSRPD